jgi:hypothetical protein
MKTGDLGRWALVATSIAALHCGPDSSSTLLVAERNGERVSGRFEAEGRAIEFVAQGSDPLAGDVQLGIGALRYDVHYDFEARDGGRAVVADGHGGAIDRASPAALLAAIGALTHYLGASREDSPLHEQMLPAALSLLRDSGGMPLQPTRFDLGPKQGTGAAESGEVDKSLGDDGIRCIQSGTSYLVSFDYGETTVIDQVVEAGVDECNGQCGPTCTQLQPWRMWTLDCLEHDTCCDVTSPDSCWTPLGECGNEYEAAMGDFLRGFDPFRKHCGG